MRLHRRSCLTSCLTPSLKTNLNSILNQKERRKEGKKERRKEESSPAARAAVDPSFSSTGSHSPTKEATELSLVWVKNVGVSFKREEFPAADQLLKAHGFEKIKGYLTDTFECPKTAKITWRDFSFWAQQFDLTRRTIDAWRRTQKIKDKTATAAKGGHAADMPKYRQESGKRQILVADDLTPVGKGFDVTEI